MFHIFRLFECGLYTTNTIMMVPNLRSDGMLKFAY